jgi:LysR family transcriptional regulator, low CO2-responsive transcriptional regulator
LSQQLSLRRLEVFCIVVETGGVTRAAEQLMIAQPAVSSQIRALEEWFGAPLFARSAGRMSTTEAGDRAYRWAKETLARGASVQRDVQELASGGAGRVVVAASMGIGSYLVPPVLTRLRSERPGADITLHAEQPDQAVHSVEVGEADFAIVSWYDHLLPESLTAKHLGDEPMLLCASPGGPPGSEVIGTAELASLPLVSVPANVAFNSATEAQLRAAGVDRLNVVIRLGHAESMKQAVIDHGWVTFLPRYCTERDRAEGRLRGVTVQGLGLFERIVLIQRKDHYFSPLQTTALDAIRTAISATSRDDPQIG